MYQEFYTHNDMTFFVPLPPFSHNLCIIQYVHFNILDDTVDMEHDGDSVPLEDAEAHKETQEGANVYNSPSTSSLNKSKGGATLVKNPKNTTVSRGKSIPKKRDNSELSLLQQKVNIFAELKEILCEIQND